jgi:hypothetical protein
MIALLPTRLLGDRVHFKQLLWSGQHGLLLRAANGLGWLSLTLDKDEVHQYGKDSKIDKSIAQNTDQYMGNNASS